MTLERLGSWVYCLGLSLLFFSVPWYFAVAMMCVGISLWEIHDYGARRERR